MKSITKVWVLFCFQLCWLASASKAQTFTYDFESDAQGWQADWADYPVTDSIFYELESKHTSLPSYIIPNQKGILIKGNNHSDDLFMFLKKKLTGLLPNRKYAIQFQLEMASDARSNAIGVGGSPGLYIKVGATTFEPKKITGDVGGTLYYVMNIDKGNQSIPGTQMDTIGKTSVSDTTTRFTIINRQNKKLFYATTNANGELWAIVGTESAFEGLSTLYYSKIVLTLTATTAVDDTPSVLDLKISPNPTNSMLYLDTESDNMPYLIYDLAGRLVEKQSFSTQNIDVSYLPMGTYFLILKKADGQIKRAKFLKIN